MGFVKGELKMTLRKEIERGGIVRKHNYLVGYEGEGQCVYGKDGYVELMTLFQAKNMAKKTISPWYRKTFKSVVYKLVKVK